MTAFDLHDSTALSFQSIGTHAERIFATVRDGREAGLPPVTAADPAIWAGGAYIDLTDPRAVDISLDAIARGLSRANRYNGHTPDPYSVAQHSDLTAGLADRLGLSDDLARVALLHDAAEAYLGDVVSPLKRLPEMARYRDLEARMEAAVLHRFGLTQAAKDWAPMVGALDKVAAAIEKTRFFPDLDWPGFPEAPADFDLVCLSADAAAALFLDAAIDLGLF